MKLTSLLSAVFAVSLLFSCTPSAQFVSVQDGRFQGVSTPYYVGTNLWYGGVLANPGKGGDRERLCLELDKLKSMGVTNLRVLVGADGEDGVLSRVEPTLQKEPGVYNEDVFVGLDYLLNELALRDMKAVLYVNNSWEWSGGYGVYLEWAGHGKALIPAQVGYVNFMNWVSQFVTDKKAKELFAQHLTNVVNRVNTVNGKPYKEDPTIFSWQIGNEPRCFSDDKKVQDAFVEWIWDSAKLIKSLDSNHMVSTGSEGAWGCQESYELFERIHSCPDIDYFTIHIWPYNWSWAKADALGQTLETAIKNTDEYIDAHLKLAKKYAKPVVIEEFGFPRDNMSYEMTSTTQHRDAYYSHIFNRVLESCKEGGYLAGCNFWAWGGYAQEGQYCGDPAQEPFGLNSVFVGDSTVKIIEEYNNSLYKLNLNY